MRRRRRRRQQRKIRRPGRRMRSVEKGNGDGSEEEDRQSGISKGPRYSCPDVQCTSRVESEYKSALPVVRRPVA